MAAPALGQPGLAGTAAPVFGLATLVGGAFLRARIGDGAMDTADIGGAAAGTGGAARITTDMATAAIGIALPQGSPLLIAAFTLRIIATKIAWQSDLGRPRKRPLPWFLCPPVWRRFLHPADKEPGEEKPYERGDQIEQKMSTHRAARQAHNGNRYYEEIEASGANREQHCSNELF
jgi:hypothetical protein